MSSPVQFRPASEMEEVAQNIRTILATPIGSAPMARDVGVLGFGLDGPLPAVQARIRQDVTEAIARHEPRAEVTDIEFTGDNTNGRLSVTVRFRLRTGGEGVVNTT